MEPDRPSLPNFKRRRITHSFLPSPILIFATRDQSGTIFMKQLIVTLVFLLMGVSTTFARQQSTPAKVTVPGTVGREQSLLARITVYWASGGRGSDRYTRQHKCATGMRLRTGHCAVDPRRIPYGSQVVFPDGTRLAAVDTGTAVKNRKAARKLGRTAYEQNALVVDRFFETKRQALAWAKKNPYFMTVRVIPPKSRSLQQPLHMQTPRIIAAVTSSASLNKGSTIVRNPLNKLGR
jgi:3D (Asp-Asp-Asp) domain-containing protein